MDRDQPIPEDKHVEHLTMEGGDLDEEAYAVANFNKILEQNYALHNNFEEVRLRFHIVMFDECT